MRSYKFGDIGFGFNISGGIKETGKYDMFRISDDEYNRLINKHTFEFVSEVPSLTDAKVVFKGSDYTIFSIDGCYTKVTDRFDEINFQYISSQCPGKEGGRIFTSEESFKKLKTSAELFRIIDFISALLYFGAFIIHASCVDVNGKALIFSGKSGVGKTTQAELWEQFGNSAIMNGDRVLLRKINNQWRAYGLPMCGSSSYCENYDLPVEAICFPEHGKFNNITVPAEIEKFMMLSSQISCGTVKPEDSEKLLLLAEKLAKEIKIIKYSCTKDEAAVTELKRYLNIK